jgi:DNA-binding GntR family transcriptional regulator
MLESLASERTIDKLDDDDFRTMEALIAQQREFIERGQYIDLIHADKEFHEFICRRADHARLLSLWQQIMGQWEVLIYRRIQMNPDETTPGVLNDHVCLLAAYRERDLAQVLELHRSINYRFARDLQAIFRQQQGLSIYSPQQISSTS